MIKKYLMDCIWQTYCSGYEDFYLNCEKGIPLIAAEIITALKIYNNIRLHIIVPFEEQAAHWNEALRDKYYEAHRRADTVTFANKHYSADCYNTSDKMMTELCDLILIFGYDRNIGGAEEYKNACGKTVRLINISGILSTERDN